MTREQVYTQQLKALGVYEDAFVPLIKDLAKAAYDKALGDWEKFGKLPEKKGRGGARPGAGRKARTG